MKKKLNSIGGYSYTLTLPIGWIKSYCEFDFVDLDIIGDKIVITPSRGNQQ